MRKLPEQVLRVNENNEVVGNTLADYIKTVAKELKVKDYKNEDGDTVKTAQDVVKDLLKSHINDDEGTFELPDEWSQYSKVSDEVRDHAKEHLKAVETQKETKKNEKAQTDAEREAKKQEKEKEEKAYTDNQESFAKFILANKDKNDKKASELFSNTIKGVTLPKSIGWSQDGMGVVVSENATKDDIAVATANIFGGLEGTTNAQAAFQFATGDLINAAIGRKIYRSKNDANEAICLVLKEKMQKDYQSASLNQYALMAERVSPSLRKQGIAPSIYLEASKIVAPRVKEGNASDQKELSDKFDGLREATIKSIAEGDIRSIKEVKAVVETFKKDNKLISGETVSASEILQKLFSALWIDRNLEHENELYTFFKSKNSTEVFTITREELTSTIESCMNSLQNMLMSKVNIPAVMKGSIVKGKGDKTSEEPFYLVDPLGQWVGYEQPVKVKEEKKEA